MRRRPSVKSDCKLIQIHTIWNDLNGITGIKCQGKSPQPITVGNNRRGVFPDRTQKRGRQFVIEAEVIGAKAWHIPAAQGNNVGNPIQPLQEQGHGARRQSKKGQGDIRTEGAKQT